jgi:hypothetical protein
LRFARVAYYITRVVKADLRGNIEIKIIITEKIVIEHYINAIIKPLNHFRKQVVALELQLVPLACNTQKRIRVLDKVSLSNIALD